MIQQPQPILSFQNITVRNQTQQVFENLTFQVNKGEHWAILGESGSGKTTLLKAIEGKVNITDGKIRRHYFEDYVKHHKVDDPLFTHRNLVAYIALKHDFRNLSNTTTFYYQQRYNAFDAQDAQTVAQYLIAVQSESKVEKPVWTHEKVIEKLNLEPLKDSQVIKLSNGETKRLMIAAALLKNPRILLLDNPLVGLDVDTRKHFDMILEAIKESGITIIMVTSPAEVPEAITNIAVLSNGKIVQSLKKEGFNPLALNKQGKKQLDIEKLKGLLSSIDEPTFQYIVKMKDVSVHYGTNLVLDNINWEIKQGERWALSGANGSGKTTLLSLINGDNPQAYANDITLFDKKRGSGESIWDIKKNIGFVSPELHQYFPLDNTCAHVIESGFYDTSGLFQKSDPEKKAIVLKWMQLFAIEAHADHLFKNTASSTQRLCLLARALIKNPALLILDEPCQGLDAAQQTYFRNIVDTICNLGNTTLIYVTHYQEELPDCIDKQKTVSRFETT